MASIIKNNPRSRPNGSTALLERRTSPLRKSPLASAAARLLSDVQHVAQQHARGETDGRIAAENFSGAEREIALAINAMLENYLRVRVRVMTCVEKLAAGDLDADLEQVAGQKHLINDTVERLRGNLRAFQDEIRRMSEEHQKGDIDVTIPADRFGGSFRTMAQGINDTVAGHIAVKKKAMACVDEFSKGNFGAPLERFPGKKAFINETIERLRANIKSFIAEMRRMSDEHNKGDIDVSIPCDTFAGDFRAMAQGVNDMVAGHISVKRKAMACVAEFAKGNFDAAARAFPRQESLHQRQSRSVARQPQVVHRRNEPHVGRAQ